MPNKICPVHGLVASPKDERDYLLSSYIPTVQRIPEVYPRLFDLDILNQWMEPSCVGFTMAGIKQFNELKEKTYRIFDGSWIYKECKKIDGMPNAAGTYFRVGLKVLKDLGAKTVSTNEDPSTYRIESYAQVDDLSFEGLKKAICLYGTVVAGFIGSNEGWKNEIVRAPREGEQTWGHATFLTHYDKDYIGGQNSWGDYYWVHGNSGGLFKFDKSYLPFEAWVVLLDKLNTPKKDVPTGWVAINWIKDNKTTANLNVREQPTTLSKILKTIPKGTEITPFGSANQTAAGYTWMQIII
jgi:uncharacterized protein YgiM (DUF1202 family)